MISALASGFPFDGTSPCADQGGAVCGIVRHITDDPDLAGTLKSLFSGGFRILLIVVIALVARAVLNRVIARIVARTSAASSLSTLSSTIPTQLPRRWLRRRRPEVPEVAVSVSTPERRRQRAETIGSVLRSIVSVSIGTIALMEILGTLGIDLAPIIASAGIVGVALGFGAQNVVKDFLSGIFMILEDQYGVGDVIDLGVGNANGTVESVGLRITRLRDIQGQVWHVRNGEVVRVANKSQGWSRAVLDVPVAYGHDVSEASGVIKRVADGLWTEPEYAGKILAEPEVLGVQDLGAHAVTIRLTVKTEPLAQWDVARQLRARIKAAFDEAGIEIPTNQQNIWVGQGPGGEAAGGSGNGGRPRTTRGPRQSGAPGTKTATTKTATKTATKKTATKKTATKPATKNAAGGR